jgi:hypothetical protein
METSKDIKGQGAIHAFFGPNFWAIKKLCIFSWTFLEN